MKFVVVPLTLREANALVEKLHRHHKPVQGYRFALGLADEHGMIRGAVIVGRPVSRGCDPRFVAEVTRLVTDGTVNACSMLYSAAYRAAKAMGFEKIQTYILDSELGTSLKASGWTLEGMTSGGTWRHTDGKSRRTDQPTVPKQRWAAICNVKRPEIKQ
jgi:hypothetical protein